jgi:hypothetical protein
MCLRGSALARTLRTQKTRRPRRSCGIGCAPPLRPEPPAFFFSVSAPVYISRRPRSVVGWGCPGCPDWAAPAAQSPFSQFFSGCPGCPILLFSYFSGLPRLPRLPWLPGLPRPPRLGCPGSLARPGCPDWAAPARNPLPMNLSKFKKLAVYFCNTRKTNFTGEAFQKAPRSFRYPPEVLDLRVPQK